MLTGPQFGAHLRATARKKRVSNAALASVAMVSRQAVNGWFRTGRISKESLAAIAPTLGVELNELFAIAPVDASAPGPTATRAEEPLPPSSGRPSAGATIASLCANRRLDAAALAPLLHIQVAQAARLVSGEAMPSPEQRRLLGAIFGINPDLITDASAVVARPVPGNARRRSLALDGHEYQLIQQYRHLPEAAQHVLRAHATVLEETFGQRSSQTPFAQGNPPGKTKADPDPPPDSDYGSW